MWEIAAFSVGIIIEIIHQPFPVINVWGIDLFSVGITLDRLQLVAVISVWRTTKFSVGITIAQVCSSVPLQCGNRVGVENTAHNQ